MIVNIVKKINIRRNHKEIDENINQRILRLYSKLEGKGKRGNGKQKGEEKEFEQREKKRDGKRR